MLANRTQKEILQIAAQNRAQRVAEDEAREWQEAEQSRDARGLREDEVPAYMQRMGPELEREVNRMLSSRDRRTRPRPSSPPHDDAEAEPTHHESRRRAADEEHQLQTPEEEKDKTQPRSPSPMSGAGESEKRVSPKSSYGASPLPPAAGPVAQVVAEGSGPSTPPASASAASPCSPSPSASGPPRSPSPRSPSPPSAESPKASGDRDRQGQARGSGAGQAMLQKQSPSLTPSQGLGGTGALEDFPVSLAQVVDLADDFDLPVSTPPPPPVVMLVSDTGGWQVADLPLQTECMGVQTWLRFFACASALVAAFCACLRVRQAAD